MLIDDMIEVTITPRNIRYYKDLGYEVPKMGQRCTKAGNILVHNSRISRKIKENL